MAHHDGEADSKSVMELLTSAEIQRKRDLDDAGVSTSALLCESPVKQHAPSRTASPQGCKIKHKQGWRGALARLDQEILILPKLIYLTLNCAIYATHNYTAMYFYKMWGIQIYQFGAVSSLSAVQFVGALFWAHLADRTGRHKSILLACTVLYGVFFCLLELNPFDGSERMTSKIVYSAVMYGVSCFFMSSMFPLVDTQVFSILSKDPNFTKETFGRQRLWGTIGHAIVTLAVGTSIYWFNYKGMFVVLGISCLAFILFILVGIPSDVKIIKGASKHGHHAPSQNATRESMQEGPTPAPPADIEQAGSPSSVDNRWAVPPIVRVLFNPHFFFLALVILCAGYVRSVMSSFLAFYMQTEMNQSEVMVAIAIMFRMLSEMAIFFYNKQLLRTLGLHWMLIIAQVAGLLRVLAYSILPPNGNWFYLSFAIELLKGTSTGCLISAGVRMAHDIAPKGCANTAQAYISGVYSGLSQAIGGALGGFIIYLLPNHSVAGMFRITFYMGMVALGLCFIKYSLIDRAIMVPKTWRT